MLDKYCVLVLLLLAGCAVGPDYVKPKIEIPEHFREGGVEWRRHDLLTTKSLNDTALNEVSHHWWTHFNDPVLDKLQDILNQNNYSIAAAESAYKGALVLVYKARIGYLPALNTTIALNRGKSTVGGTVSATHSISLDATWEPDLWGSVSSNIDSTAAGADVALAQLQAVRLSTQGSLAQYYFEYRMLEVDQRLLDKIVDLNQKLLDYTQNRYKAGLLEQEDVENAKQQLQIAQTNAMNNGINLAQYEHAIAVLLGQLPSTFTLKSVDGGQSTMEQKLDEELYLNSKLYDLDYTNHIPVIVPSVLLERRPDIIQAERQIAQANANIGVAKASFFPVLNLLGDGTQQGNGWKHLASLPTLLWSLGPQLALNITNLAAYPATMAAVNENYNGIVSNYRQTVLNAFQEVEDDLSALKILKEALTLADKRVASSKVVLESSKNHYRTGISDYSEVLSAQISYYNSYKNFNDAVGLHKTTAILLIKALGGGQY